jgi:tetratricopeptide (TPR) repeat protein
VILAGGVLAVAALLLALAGWRPGFDAPAEADPLVAGSLLIAWRPPAVPLISDGPLIAMAEADAALPLPAPGPPGLASGGKLASTAGVARGGIVRPLAEPDNPLYHEAWRLQRAGETGAALAAYRRAAAADPGHAATFYNWGYLLQRQGDAAGARAQYRAALQLAPQHAFAHYNLACLLDQAGDRQGALEHYRAAIAARPDFAWSYYNLGYLEQRLGHYREALANYRRAIERDPEQTLAYQNIATILRYHRP